MIYAIAPSGSFPKDQLALVGNRIEYLQELSTAINKLGCLKPLDNLKVADLRVELQSRGVNTNGMLKRHLSAHLTDILRGA